MTILFRPQGGFGWVSYTTSRDTIIFNGGRLDASLDYAEIQRDIQLSNYQKSIQVAFREVCDGLAAIGTYGGQLQAQSALVQADQEYFDMAHQRYDEGVDSYLTLLDAQRELFAARQKLLSERLAQLSAQVQLYKALGGWLADIHRNHHKMNDARDRSRRTEAHR
jgi:multidrug efflux system outer membrane protein